GAGDHLGEVAARRGPAGIAPAEDGRVLPEAAGLFGSGANVDEGARRRRRDPAGQVAPAEQGAAGPDGAGKVVRPALALADVGKAARRWRPEVARITPAGNLPVGAETARRPPACTDLRELSVRRRSPVARYVGAEPAGYGAVHS